MAVEIEVIAEVASVALLVASSVLGAKYKWLKDKIMKFKKAMDVTVAAYEDGEITPEELAESAKAWKAFLE